MTCTDRTWLRSCLRERARVERALQSGQEDCLVLTPLSVILSPDQLTSVSFRQLVSKDQEIAKFKEDEARRIVTLEDRLMQSMRAEIARASPSKHGAGV